MKQPPAFQFYVSNFIEGTSDMEQAEVGAYIRLLCYQWTNTAIPDDSTRLERVAGGPVTEHVMVKFPKGADGKRRNHRLETVRRKAVEFQEKCAVAGRRGGGNPNFKPGQPNPYYDSKDKGQDKGEHKGDGKGSDKGEINSPISDLRSPSLILELQSPPLVKGAGKQSNLPDADWIASLKSGSAYLGIDIDRELARMQAWAAVHRKVPSRRRFLTWLNRAEKPLSTNGHPGTPAAPKPLSLFELKTILQAKELQAKELQARFSSEVALGVAWSNDAKKSEWYALRKEIKELNNRMASYAR